MGKETEVGWGWGVECKARAFKAVSFVSAGKPLEVLS